MKRWFLLGCLLSTSLWACDEKAASQSRKDDAAEDDDGAKKKKKKAKRAEEDDGTIPAPEAGEAPKLEVGAWAKYRVLGPGGAEQGHAKWSTIEVRNGNEYLVEGDIQLQMPMIAQAWVRVGDLAKRETIEIVEVKAKLGSAPPQTFPVGANSPMNKAFDSFLQMGKAPEWADTPQEKVEVPAGTFAGCYKWSRTATFMGVTTKSTIYTHPAVPLPAMVKMVADDTTWELVEYARSGAKRSF